MNDEIQIRHELRPGDLGLVTTMHGRIYAAEFDYSHIFEAYVADSLAEFGKHYDPVRDRLWIAERAGIAVGSIGLLGRPDNTAQLRWLLVSPEARGSGLGWRLLDSCLAFGRECGYTSIYLWTVHALDTASALYLRAGFNLTEELPASRLWGPELAEQRYDLALSDPD